jgi:DNA-binding XRE family transcriptional regulator
MRANAAAIKAIRERSGLSKEVAASRTNGKVSRTHWHNIETGKRGCSDEALVEMAKAIRAPLDAIVYYSHEDDEYNGDAA